MNITIIYDNSSSSSDVVAGWGFSCLVDRRILFDTGENGDSLLHNMEQLNSDPSKIELVVISHDHWDHTGGLWELLKVRRGLRVYSCPGFSQAFKNKVEQLGGDLVEADSHLQIGRGISVTGEIPGKYKDASMPEQALTVETQDGITVITGCSHPGIVSMVRVVKQQSPDSNISLVFGGFHLMNQDRRTIQTIAESMKEMGVERVGPTHCTGYDAQLVFKQVYRDNYLTIQAGNSFEI